MTKTHTLYSLLIVVAMTFGVACDDTDEVVTNEAGAEVAGTMLAGTEAGAEAGTDAGTDAGTEAGTDAGTRRWYRRWYRGRH